MKIVEEFKQFAMRGNVLDMAVGVIVGGAFGKITASLVSDVIMPPIGRLLGGADFSNLFVALGPGNFTTIAEAQTAKVATLNYGLFINTIINFLIVAFSVFLLVKGINTLQKKKEEAPKLPLAPPRQEVLLEEIKDLLAETVRK